MSINRDIAIAVEDAIAENTAAIDLVRELYAVRNKYESSANVRDILLEMMADEPLRGEELRERLAAFVTNAEHVAELREADRRELAAATAAVRSVVERLDVAVRCRRDALRMAIELMQDTIRARSRPALQTMSCNPALLFQMDRAGLCADDLELLRKIKTEKAHRQATKPELGTDDQIRAVICLLVNEDRVLELYLKDRHRGRSFLPDGLEQMFAAVADVLAADHDKNWPSGPYQRQLSAWFSEIMTAAESGHREGEVQRQVQAT